jgi:ABC-type sugar transport system permease subunit
VRTGSCAGLVLLLLLVSNAAYLYLAPLLKLDILAVQYPYLFAFEPEFTEVRHCNTGELLQLIPQPGMTRLLAGDFIAPAQKHDGIPLRRVNGEVLIESEGSLYALRPMQQ